MPAKTLSEAEDELGVVRHAVGCPGRVEGQLDLDLLDPGERGDGLVDRLLDHRSRRAAHRREGVHDLDVLALELGLYYDTEIEGDRVKIVHSLTSMGCPAGPMIQESIHEAVVALPGVEQVEVELTFDPPWTPDRMSDDAKFILGFG